MKDIPIGCLENKYPFISAYFSANKIDTASAKNQSIMQLFDSYSDAYIEENAIDKDNLIAGLYAYINEMSSFLGLDEDKLETLTILPGQDKNGQMENFGEITIQAPEIISIVGPTGAGKSRLLADIETIAQKDTPSRRTILLDGKAADRRMRFSSNNKLVAQLSQNMNFVIDLSVQDFLLLHAESRMIENSAEVIARIICAANNLSGEHFERDAPVTSLSGGQSRALMIADTAILSKSPIILIDEIENAGIDRHKALKLLQAHDKIVLISTHDPLLALLANRRIVIKNGGIDKVIATTTDEKQLLIKLEGVDNSLQLLRQKLRLGSNISEKDFIFTHD